MKKDKIAIKKAKIQFILIATDYIEQGTHFYTPEQEEEMILYRERLKKLKNDEDIPTLPSFFPYSYLYDYLFRK